MAARPMTPAERKAMAALFLMFGLFMLAMAFGWVKTEPSRVHAPLWVLAACGMVFNLGSVLIFLVGREGVDTLRNLVAWLFFVAVAIPLNWIAFGSGERTFSGSISSSGFSLIRAVNEWGGRLGFGFAALLIDGFLLWWTVQVLRGKPAFARRKAP